MKHMQKIYQRVRRVLGVMTATNPHTFVSANLIVATT